MIRYTQRDFEPLTIISNYLVVSATVVTDGLQGKFDTLRVALEHLQTHGTDKTVLSLPTTLSGELQFSGEALALLVEGYARWLYEAGLPPAGELHRSGD